MLRTTEKAKLIRAELKTLGITSKQVSVTCRSGSIDCYIKDLSVEPEVVEKIAKKYENVRYCEYSQEILQGGNTFVFVQYDSGVETGFLRSDKGKELVQSLAKHLEELEQGQGRLFRDTNMFVGKSHRPNTIYCSKDSNSESFYHVGSLAFHLECLRAQGKIEL